MNVFQPIYAGTGLHVASNIGFAREERRWWLIVSCPATWKAPISTIGPGHARVFAHSSKNSRR